MPEIKIAGLTVNNIKAGHTPIPRYKALLYLIKDVLLFNHGAEIGVRDGDTAMFLLESIPSLTMELVDPYISFLGITGELGKYRLIPAAEQHEHYLTMLKNIEPYMDRVAIHKVHSGEASDRIKDRSLDFVFIDGNHAFEHVLEDLFFWKRKIRPGGMLTGHDLGNHGVQKALKYMFIGTDKVITNVVNGDEVWGIAV